MENPFKIKPGEKLALGQVLERYLDWDQWNKDRRRSAGKEGCDRDLLSGHLCCADHMALSAECDAFFAYLFHLTYDSSVRSGVGFSMDSMRAFILENDLAVPPEKAARFHHISQREWLAYLRE